MADLVIDTHTVIWYFANSPEISVLATQTIKSFFRYFETFSAFFCKIKVVNEKEKVFLRS